MRTPQSINLAQMPSILHMIHEHKCNHTYTNSQNNTSLFVFTDTYSVTGLETL